MLWFFCLSSCVSPLGRWGCAGPVWPWRSCLCRWFWEDGSSPRAAAVDPQSCGSGRRCGTSACRLPVGHYCARCAVDRERQRHVLEAVPAPCVRGESSVKAVTDLSAGKQDIYRHHSHDRRELYDHCKIYSDKWKRSQASKLYLWIWHEEQSCKSEPPRPLRSIWTLWEKIYTVSRSTHSSLYSAVNSDYNI